ncbi:MAG: hypothetical protein ACOH2F_17430, partial [Cellulomonas sp.]
MTENFTTATGPDDELVPPPIDANEAVVAPVTEVDEPAAAEETTPVEAGQEEAAAEPEVVEPEVVEPEVVEPE